MVVTVARQCECTWRQWTTRLKLLKRPFSCYVYFTTISKIRLHRKWNTFDRFHFKEEMHLSLTKKSWCVTVFNQPITKVLPTHPINAILPHGSESLEGRRGGHSNEGCVLSHNTELLIIRRYGKILKNNIYYFKFPFSNSVIPCLSWLRLPSYTFYFPHCKPSRELCGTAVFLFITFCQTNSSPAFYSSELAACVLKEHFGLNATGQTLIFLIFPKWTCLKFKDSRKKWAYTFVISQVQYC